VVSGPPPLRLGAALAVLRILDLGRDEGFTESGFNLSKNRRLASVIPLYCWWPAPLSRDFQKKSSPDNFDFVRISPAQLTSS
jgi:hypothetical protein